MRLELSLVFDESSRFLFALFVLLDARKVKYFSISLDALQHFVQKSSKIVFVPRRLSFTGILENGADFSLDVLAVYEQYRLHFRHCSNRKRKTTAKLAVGWGVYSCNLSAWRWIVNEGLHEGLQQIVKPRKGTALF